MVNPSGGLESKGHPIGATGIAQCAELCWQVEEARTCTRMHAVIGLHLGIHCTEHTAWRASWTVGDGLCMCDQHM